MKKVLAAALALLISYPVIADCVLRQSDATEITLGPYVDDDGITPATGLTISQGDVILKKCAAAGDCAASAQKNDSGACAHDANGMYECDLDATDTNTVGILEIWSYETGNLIVWKSCLVIEESVYDASLAAGAAGSVAQTGDSYARLGAPAGASHAVDIAAIEAQTDDIGVAGAGLTALATQASVNTVDTVVDAIKVKTDQLTFTVTGEVDANTKSMNDAEVCGDGTSGDKWAGCP